MNVLDIRIKALERQIDTLKTAIAQPVGLFETIDAMIKNFRVANRETLQALGFGGTAYGRIVSGQYGGARPLELLRKRPLISEIRRFKLLPVPIRNKLGL